MDEIDLTAETIDLTDEQLVAADTAMLLDLGGAEELADRIAAQSLGVGDTVADRTSIPGTLGGHTDVNAASGAGSDEPRSPQ
jgi:hypothetical protein